MYWGTVAGFVIGLIATITFALWQKRAMPALLFILPMELLGISVAAYIKYGRIGLEQLIKFDEETALKQTPSSVLADSTKLPLK